MIVLFKVVAVRGEAVIPTPLPLLKAVGEKKKLAKSAVESDWSSLCVRPDCVKVFKPPASKGALQLREEIEVARSEIG